MIIKKIVLFAALLAGVFSVQAQSTLLSPRTAMKVLEIREGQCPADYLYGVVTLAEGVDLKALGAYGVSVNTVVGNMMTVQIPGKNLSDLVASGLCAYIDLGHPVIPLLDKARTDLGVDYIHQGVNLPQGYDGSGVVVGIIDGGFQYGHPSFYDTTGTTLRIKRVWNQRDSSGTAPAGFSYGTELTNPEQILAAVTDNEVKGHGTHVAGIAAGCGAPDAHGRRYSGMAPAADIVMVATQPYETGLVDGMRYIHEYARSVGKPCVINISLGTVTGPHDGLGTYDIMFENYLDGLDSVVVVVSAANSGDNRNHLQHTFSPSDTVVNTFCNAFFFRNYAAAADCWGDVGDQFSLSVSLHDFGTYDGNDSLIGETPMVSSAVDSVYQFQLTTTRNSVFNCEIAVTSVSPNNQRPNILVYITNPGIVSDRDLFALKVQSTSANVHIWSDEMDFSSNGNPQYTDGDAAYTIGGEAANTDAVISVGSYATRTQTLEGTLLSQTLEGDLSPFSSHGPTYDGRVKPDICAPGEYIVSAINTPYLAQYLEMYTFDSLDFNGETCYYVLMQGTTMSSPAMAGIVALWMQNNPALNVDSTRTLLHTTALHDAFTGAIPATGSNSWGWGKVNAFGGLPATSLPMYKLDVASENFLKGYVAGQGRHPQGQYTIEAFSRDGFAFQQWNDGNTDNPRIVDLVSDTSFMAYYEEADCDTITQFPWEAIFNEGSLQCWDNFGTPLWEFRFPSMTSMGDGEVDSWLVTPHVLVEPQTALYFNYLSVQDSMAIVAITGSGDTLVLSDKRYVFDASAEDCVPLSSLAGQTVRLGFHHHHHGSYGIVTLTNVRIDYLQGIGEVAPSRWKVETSGLRLTVTGEADAQLNVYDVMGRCVVSSPKANGTFLLPAAGVYVVQLDGQFARKVVVH